MQNYYDVVDRNGKPWDMSTIFMKKDIQWVVECCLVRITPKKNECDYGYWEEFNTFWMTISKIRWKNLIEAIDKDENQIQSIIKYLDQETEGGIASICIRSRSPNQKKIT